MEPATINGASINIATKVRLLNMLLGLTSSSFQGKTSGISGYLSIAFELNLEKTPRTN